MMSPGAPRLRGDLLISQQSTGAGTIFVIKDPVARGFFRFGEVEYFVAQQLDGATALDVVRQRIEQRFDCHLRAETLEQFIEQFRRCRLLEGTQPDVAERARRPLRGSLLYLRLKAFDPDRLFDRLLPRVAWVFSPRVLAGSAVIVLIALGMTVAGWGEIARDIQRLYRFDALLLAWVVMLTVTTGHEFAHGLTCKHFGGHVHEIGFLLLYFQPAFYCNISDAWLFPEKSQRLWTTFAGAYFEMVVWALATLTWAVTDTDTQLNFLALVVMATSAVKTLFNLNPLIKLDGYYLLSDYLETPNLRQKSLGYLKAVIHKIWQPSIRVAQISRRVRRIYLAYGVLAVVYSCWLLGVITVQFGGFLVERFRGPGFILFTGLLMIAFQNPVNKVTSRLKNMFAFMPPAVPRLKISRRTFLLVAVLPALFLVRTELKVSGEFTILPRHNADVRAQVDGIIEEIYVEEGRQVAAGDPIARLADRDYRSEIRQIDAELDKRRAHLKMLRAGPTRLEVDVARTAVATARTRRDHLGRQYAEAQRVRASRRSVAETTVAAADTRLRYAGTGVKRSQELFGRGLVSRTELEQGEEQVRLRETELEAARAELATVVDDQLSQLGGDLAVAIAAVEEAEKKLEVVVAGSRPEEIEGMEAEVAQLEARWNYLDEQKRLATITAPAPGVVVTPRLHEKLGEQLKKGDLLAEVYDLERLTPEIIVSEKEIGDVKTGQPVIFRARAHPETTFSGRVKAISPRGAISEGPERKVFRVLVEIDQPTTLLKAEMTGNAKILCGARSLFDILTRRIARYVRVEFWSWW
jgi:putative peptide zinc metalloprotease protein